MKTEFYIMALTSLTMLTGMTACKSTPPFAASGKTWKLKGTDGTVKQIWSDHIQMPDCDKEEFDGADIDCRSITINGTTYYLYSWNYVLVHSEIMCPYPWRIPSESDILRMQTMVATLFTGDDILAPELWKNLLGVERGAAYKMSSRLVNNRWMLTHKMTSDYAFWLMDDTKRKYVYLDSTTRNGYPSLTADVEYFPTKADGFMVRCVK
jgi:uncharacterized protein (TIGR02145 family)